MREMFDSIYIYLFVLSSYVSISVANGSHVTKIVDYLTLKYKFMSIKTVKIINLMCREMHHYHLLCVCKFLGSAVRGS